MGTDFFSQALSSDTKVPEKVVFQLPLAATGKWRIIP